MNGYDTIPIKRTATAGRLDLKQLTTEQTSWLTPGLRCSAGGTRVTGRQWRLEATDKNGSSKI